MMPDESREIIIEIWPIDVFHAVIAFVIQMGALALVSLPGWVIDRIAMMLFASWYAVQWC
jgi:hypothetical protein